MLEIEIYPGRFEEVKTVEFGRCTYYPKALLVMADEMTEVVEGDNYQMVNSIKESISSIARLGRAAACHLALATQRPSGNVISGDLKNNIHQSVILGDFDSAMSTLIFDEDISHKSKPHIKGRGFIKVGKDIIETQTYWTDPKKDFVYKKEIVPNKGVLDNINDEDNEISEPTTSIKDNLNNIDTSNDSHDLLNNKTNNNEDVNNKEIPENIKEFNISIDDILGDEEEEQLKEVSKALEPFSEGPDILRINMENIRKDKEENVNIKISRKNLLSNPSVSNIKLKNLNKETSAEDIVK